jgi:hypothetical protein
VITQNGNFLVSSSGNGNQWYNQSTGPISTDASYIPNQTGNYYVIVKVNGCESAPSNIVSINITSVNENIENPYHISIYPNPITENSTLTYTLDKDETVSISFFDITGHEIYKSMNIKESKGAHNFKINASSLSSGLYFYKLQIGNVLQNGKFLVK